MLAYIYVQRFHGYDIIGISVFTKHFVTFTQLTKKLRSKNLMMLFINTSRECVYNGRSVILEIIMLHIKHQIMKVLSRDIALNI